MENIETFSFNGMTFGVQKETKEPDTFLTNILANPHPSHYKMFLKNWISPTIGYTADTIYRFSVTGSLLRIRLCFKWKNSLKYNAVFLTPLKNGQGNYNGNPKPIWGVFGESQ